MANNVVNIASRFNQREMMNTVFRESSLMESDDAVTEVTQVLNHSSYSRPVYSQAQENFTNDDGHSNPSLLSSLKRSDNSRSVGVGDTVNNRFVLTELLGVGGMGKVYRALDKRKQEAQDNNPYIAIKILGDEFKKHPQAFITLQREAKKTQALAHPNIITVYDFDRDHDLVYLTMEELRGQSLKGFLASRECRRMTRKQRLKIVTQIVDGLAYAHSKGTVHSDLKPGNVFVGDDGVVKILDFGIARAVNQKLSHDVFDAGDLAAFSYRYASLEMLNREKPHPSDDIYALGLIVCELLQGKHPYENKDAKRVKADRSVAVIPSSFNPLFKRTLKQAVSVSRHQRIQDAKSLKNHLQFSRLLPKRLLITLCILLSAVFANQYYVSTIDIHNIAFSEISEVDQIAFKHYLDQGYTAFSLNIFEDSVINFNKAYLIHGTNSDIRKARAIVLNAFQDSIDKADTEELKRFRQQQLRELRKYPAFESVEQ